MLRITGFVGANKAVHPLLIANDTIGVDSRNQRPGRGDLRPWRAPLTVASVGGGTQIYRMGRDVASDSLYWLGLTGDVDVMRGFIADDASERTFWTDGVQPKWVDNTFGLASAPYPTTTRNLGVPKPDAAATLAIQTAGSGEAETHAYVTTWVNDRGEESEPTAAFATLTSNAGSTRRVTRNATVPSGAWGITGWRIYRTQPGAQSSGLYFFVAQVAAATALYDDATATVTDPMLCATWSQPPAGLRGLKALWNGIAVAFVGKSIRFCVPYRPFAWPIKYELLCDDTIVGLAAFQETLLVLTVGQPYVVTGSDPSSMRMQRLEFKQACVAKKGIVEFGHGAAWPSPDGLAYVGEGTPRVLTKDLFMREDWLALAPSTMVAGLYEGRYLVSYNPGGGRTGFMLDPQAPDGVLYMDAAFTSCFNDPLQDALYLQSGTDVQKWDAGAPMTAAFESKDYRTPPTACFGWGKVIADAYPVTLNLWAGGVQRMVNYSVTSARAFRLPGGFRAEKWRVRLATTGAVQGALLADSIAELQSA